MSTMKSIRDRLSGPIGQFLKGAVGVYIKRRDTFALNQLKTALSRFFRGRSISRVNAIDMYIELLTGEELDRYGVFESLGYKFIRFDKKEYCHTLWDDFSNIVLTDFYNQGELLRLLAPELPPDFIPSSQSDFLFYLIGEGPYQYGDVRIKPDDVVIDAGANMGVFSLFAAKRGAFVHAFEPQQSCFDVLSSHISMNSFGESIVPWKLALGDKRCTVEFSSLEGALDSGATMIQSRVRENRSSFSVDCISLDEWASENGIGKIDFIKADIEGAERLLLKGAGNTLKEQKPRLSICTYHLHDDPEVLKSLILQANPSYRTVQLPEKIFAW